MAVTNRYDTYKKYKDDPDFQAILESGGSRDLFSYKGNPVVAFWAGLQELFGGPTLVDKYKKQRDDYAKTYGTESLAGNNVSVGSATVTTTEGLPPSSLSNNTLNLNSSPKKKKKRGNDSASALGL